MAAKKRSDAELAPPPRSVDRAALLEFMSKTDGFAPARPVLRRVRAVPTIFPYYDWATGVMGHPLERVALVHGPSSHGKTLFCHGLGLSFLMRDHFYKLIDAEMTTPITWLETLMGTYADHPQFVATRPDTYEKTVDEVRSFAEGVGEMKAKGIVPPETGGLIVVDSIKKLVPKRLMEKIDKAGADGDGGIDGMSGRAAMYKAALNSQWMDELVPLMHETGCTMVLIGRENENTEKKNKYDADWKLTGGKAIFFDSSLVIRITRAAWNKEGSGEDAETVGEKHRAMIYKTKIAGKDDKTVSAFFNSSNGRIVPEGFDRPRDVFQLAEQFGLIEKSGAWYNYAGERLGQGETNVVKSLHGNPDLVNQLDEKVRALFASKVLAEDVVDTL